MATEWYLMNTKYNQVSGFESEFLDDYAQDGFLQALNSGIADTVELYNYDLSESTTIKAIITNKMQDTKLQSLTRQILAPIGSCKAGMYVKYKDKYWLIVGNVDDNSVYEKGVMVLCNYLLTWINSEGKIIQRWANCVSASQYNNGETGMKFYFVRSDQLLISIPDDDECLLLSSGQRFIIDKRCKIYEKNLAGVTEKDTSKPLITYELTRSDTVLYDYQDSGHSEFIAYQDEQREGDGYYVINGKGYWLCDGDTTSISTTTKYGTAEIVAECDVIYCGIEPAVFTAKFGTTYSGACSKFSTDTVVTPSWSIDADFVDELEIEYVDNSIIISTSNKKLIGKTFTLTLSGDGYEPVDVDVDIIAFL